MNFQATTKQMRHSMKSAILAGIIIGTLGLNALNAHSALISRNDVLVTTRVIGGSCCQGGTLKQFTPEGNLVQSKAIPNNVETDDTRDVVVGKNGLIHVFNGTFSPFLSTYDSTAETWTHRTFADWSTINNVTYGGIATLNDFVYVTDMRTFGNEAKGIIRFDLANDTAERFDTKPFLEDGPIDLTLGLDGFLYSFYDGVVEKIDPLTMDSLGIFFVPGGMRGIAVAANGDIFGAHFDGELVHMDSSGTELNRKIVTVDSNRLRFTDIDLSSDGELIVGTTDNLVVQSNVDFSDVSMFVGDESGNITATFVAFRPVEVEVQVSEPPATYFLGSLVAISFLHLCRRAFRNGRTSNDSGLT